MYVDNEIRKNVQGTRDGTGNVAGADRRTKCRGADEDDDGGQEMLGNGISKAIGRRSGETSEERGGAG